ncbi:MAG: hypothetical protein LAO06_07945 [Acidobacteriia bacterium]|nr:hypothetical protein [Terriglobia bacterium]
MPVLFGLLCFLVGCAFFLGGPALWAYARSLQFREPRTIICPETRRWAEVTVDGGHAARTEFAGRIELRLLACSRWPQRRDCDQACAPQVPMVGDDRRITPYTPFALEPRFLRINNPVRMSPTLYARLAAQLAPPSAQR